MAKTKFLIPFLVLILLFLTAGSPQPVNPEVKAITGLLDNLPTHYLDTETPSERKVRLNTIATSIDRAASRAVCEAPYASTKFRTCTPIFKGTKDEMVILLVTIGFWESRFAQNIHEGKCRAWQCDPIQYKDTAGNIIKVVHKAHTNWQLQYNTSIATEWRVMVGTDQNSTDAAAWASAKMLSRGYNSCGNVWGSISKYAGVRSCKWSKGKKRVDFYRHKMYKYKELLKE